MTGRERDFSLRKYRRKCNFSLCDWSCRLSACYERRHAKTCNIDKTGFMERGGLTKTGWDEPVNVTGSGLRLSIS